MKGQVSGDITGNWFPSTSRQNSGTFGAELETKFENMH